MSPIDRFVDLKERVLRTILARRVTLGVFAGVALVVKFTSGISYLNPLYYTPVAWFLLTFPFATLVRRQKSERWLHWVHTGYFLAEIALITLFVHWMGGSEWIGNIFYLFTVITANFFLPRMQGYLVTAVVILLYAGLALLEYAGVIPHRSLFALLGEPHRSLSYTLTTILAGVVGVYLVLTYTVRTFTEIDANKNRMLAKREAELAALSNRLLSAQDVERRRIAHELHDTLGQSLAAVRLRLAALRDRIGADEHEAMAATVDQAIRETRTLAYSLRPPLLDDLGLVPSLRRLAAMVREGSGLEVSLELEEGERPSGAVESLLFSVAQEALSNVERHAKARRVVIRLRRHPGRLGFEVEDDGVGFRPEDRSGLGLRGMVERVEAAGGRVHVVSSPGSGARISVEVPCETDPGPRCG